MEGNGGAGGDGWKKARGEQAPADDRLGELPDSLLLHILSFLPMEDVVPTALLARRWRHLWTFTPCLDFFRRPTWRRALCRHLPPEFIDRALTVYEGAKIRSFRAGLEPLAEWKDYDYAELGKMVDSWLRFALGRRVEELELCCWVPMFAQPYRLPGCVFTCGSLVSFTLQDCRVDLPSRISMSSLRNLTLCSVMIADYNLKGLLAGCPALECLTLEDCHPRHYGGICVEGSNSRLKTLKIRDYIHYKLPGDYGICISCPSIKKLVLIGYLRAYRAKGDWSSIVTASLDFRPIFGWDADVRDCYDLACLLFDLRHVKALKLSSWSVQVLSLRAYESSWFSSEFNIVSLELAIGFITSEFLGILKALRSFTKLEYLTIDITCESEKIKFVGDTSEFDDVEATYVMPNKRSSPTMLRHLKTVSIFGLVRAICAEDKNETVEEVTKKLQNGLEVIQFLLESSPVLERLVINTAAHGRKLTTENLGILCRFALRLLALPRASPKALVIIQDE